MISTSGAKKLVFLRKLEDADFDFNEVSTLKGASFYLGLSRP